MKEREKLSSAVRFSLEPGWVVIIIIIFKARLGTMRKEAGLEEGEVAMGYPDREF